MRIFFHFSHLYNLVFPMRAIKPGPLGILAYKLLCIGYSGKESKRVRKKGNYEKEQHTDSRVSGDGGGLNG